MSTGRKREYQCGHCGMSLLGKGCVLSMFYEQFSLIYILIPLDCDIQGFYFTTGCNVKAQVEESQGPPGATMSRLREGIRHS